MCGILYTDDPRVSHERFRAALSLLHHRGPDAKGWAAHGNAQLGHTRLKILDLDDRSNQPFYSCDGRFALIYNGEIYNYRELAREVGLETRTSGDTEVLTELLARSGPAALERLNGMFAFVLLDVVSGEVLVARDRLGIKPLYFRRFEGSLTVCSEIAPIVELFGETQIDEIGLRQYRKLRTFFNGRTAFARIEMFPAGSYLHHENAGRYWELPRGRQEAPADEELRELMERAVRRRLIADVAVGSYLSGGLDSTLVTALSKAEHSWTVGFAEHNEFSWARLAADRLGTAHHEVLLREEDFKPLAEQMVDRRREPLSVPNEVLLREMTRAVKRHNTVVLSGEGADELFFGYDRIFRWAARCRRWDLEGFAACYGYGSNDDLEIVQDAVEPFLDRGEPLAIVAAFFQVAHLHGLLRRLDNATMESSVEARVPFVDHTLVERMAGVPFEARMPGGVVKAPLKRVFADLVPAQIVERPKVGFPVSLEAVGLGGEPGEHPMDAWLRFNWERFSRVVQSGKERVGAESGRMSR